MKKTLLALTAALVAVFAAHAQTAGPGQDRSVPAAAATKEEKAAAKDARKEEGKKVSKTMDVSDKPSTTAKAKAATPAEKKAAADKRKAEGAAATKEPKDKSAAGS